MLNLLPVLKDPPVAILVVDAVADCFLSDLMETNQFIWVEFCDFLVGGNRQHRMWRPSQHGSGQRTAPRVGVENHFTR
jgi:hypothetical protein